MNKKKDRIIQQRLFDLGYNYEMGQYGWPFYKKFLMWIEYKLAYFFKRIYLLWREWKNG